MVEDQIAAVFGDFDVGALVTGGHVPGDEAVDVLVTGNRVELLGRGVRFGTSSHVARFLLAAREFDPDLRYAVNCRFDDVERALDATDWPVTEYDRGEEPEAVKAAEGSTMQWGARQAFEAAEGTPVAVAGPADPGDVGEEAMVKLLAPDAETLTERTLGLRDEVETE